MIKKFTYLVENLEEKKDFKSEIKSMIEKSLKTSDSKTIEDFIEAYKKDSENNQIEGLINKSDIFDMYIKYSDDIDELLNNKDFYSNSPDDLNIFSLYDYVIEGTIKAVYYVVNSF